SVADAEAVVFDGYEGRILSLTFLNDSYENLDFTEFNLRDVPLCVKKYSNGDTIIGYNVEVSDTEGRGFLSKALNRKDFENYFVIQFNKYLTIDYVGRSAKDQTVKMMGL